MGEMTSEDWEMIANARTKPDGNTLRFFKMEKVSVCGSTLTVDKFRGISVNSCDFLDLKAKNIADGGIVIKFDKMLPDFNEIDCKEWRYNKEDRSLYLRWGNFGNIDDTFKIVDADSLGFYLGDFSALGDMTDALDSLMTRIGDYFVRR